MQKEIKSNFFRCLCVFIVLLFLITSFSCVTAKIDLNSDPESVVTDSLKRGDFPAIAVAVVRDGAMIFQTVEGERKMGSGIPVQTADAFHLGSNTKAMTALLCGISVDRGLLKWDSTISSILKGKVPFDVSFSDITLTELLSHTSGLHNDVSKISWMSYFIRLKGDDAQQADRKRMALEILQGKINSDGRGNFLYSNLNYVLAGFLLETISGKSWETLMKENLFDPLKLSSAGFGPCASDGSTNGLWGHNPAPVEPGVYADNPASFGPAGTVHMNLQDVIKYLSIYFDDGQSVAGKKLISDESLKKIMTIIKDNYGLGWSVYDAGGTRMLAHDGSNTMNYATFLVYPEKKSAVVVMTNRGDGQTQQNVEKLARYFNSKYLGDYFKYP